ncbi:uncharacterized protein [Pseudorasbora parva]|uniref:uncharacterized protein n=1 Tax=Pseudorasbora parva TaxID=51549 RepID=UPI00351EC622
MTLENVEQEYNQNVVIVEEAIMWHMEDVSESIMDATLCSNTVKQFAVVKFVKSNTVDAVPTNWLETTEKTVFCYWPQKNVTAKVKRREIPDKTLWAKCKVSVLTYTDTYNKARDKVNQATMTSNLDSDQEVETGRKIVTPARYLDSDTDIDEPFAKRVKTLTDTATMNQTPQMPKMPSFTPSMDFFSARHNEDSPTFHTNLDVTPTRTMLQSNDQGPSITSTPNTTPNTQNDSCTPAYVRAIFMRLDKIELSLQTIQSILTKTMSSDDPEIEELTRSLQTPAQLEEASDKLKDLAHRKKVVDYLSLLGGKTPGDSVRRMMREIGTNGLWANYSLKGRKGKRNFQDLAIYPIIIQACHKIHPTTLQKTIENCIADTLRYAPHRVTQRDNGGPSMDESQLMSQEHAAAAEGSGLIESAD